MEKSKYIKFKVPLRQVSSEYVRFPCQLSFHQMLHTHLSKRDSKIGQLVADVPSGLNLTPTHVTLKKKKAEGLDAKCYTN
jgi:hypothetical protein